MPDQTPNWGINPIALAELITGKTLSAEKDLRELLQKAFDTELDAIFAAKSRFVVLQQLADAIREPKKLGELLNDDRVKSAIERFGPSGEKIIQRILPFLVPVSDVTFALPGAAPLRPSEIGTWRTFPDNEYIDGDVSYLDPKQGAVADCYLIAAIIALAWSRPADWTEQVMKTRGQYRYRFFNGNQEEFKQIGPELPRDPNGMLVYAGSSTNSKEAWPGMLEKAYVMWRCNPAGEPTSADYQNIPRLQPAVACHILCGGECDWRRALGAGVNSLVKDVVLDRCDGNVTKDPTIASTWASSAMWELAGLWPNHAYAVLGFIGERAQPQYVVLRNPHGIVKPGMNYPEGPWKPDPAAAAQVALNEYGVFAVPANSFDKYMQEVGWVKL